MLLIVLSFYLFILVFNKSIAKTFPTHETSVYTRPETTIIRVARMHDGLMGGFPCTVERVMEWCALAVVAPRKGQPSISTSAVTTPNTSICAWQESIINNALRWRKNPEESRLVCKAEKDPLNSSSKAEPPAPTSSCALREESSCRHNDGWNTL